MIATDAMAKHHGNVERAVSTFVKEIDGDRDLIREALAHYLRTYLPGADHVIGDAHNLAPVQSLDTLPRVAPSNAGKPARRAAKAKL